MVPEPERTDDESAPTNETVDPPSDAPDDDATDATDTDSTTPPANAEQRGESADEERPVPVTTETQSRFAPRGGWLGPSQEAIKAGQVKRDFIKPADLFHELIHGRTVKRVVCEGLNASKKEMRETIEISKSTLTRINFRQATFNANVTFKNCVIDNLDIHKATFNKDCVFEACEFRGSVINLKNFTCKGSFKIRDCTFGGKLLVASATIGQLFDAWDSTFTGWVDFRGVTFNGEADFRSVDADEGFVFTASTFKKSILLRGAVVQKKFAFQRECKLEGCLDLQKAKLHGYAYFDELEFGENATISVWNCTSIALQLKSSQIEGRLAPLKAGDHAKAAEEYGVLKNNYQKLNWLDEEDWAYYHFKREQRMARHGTKGGITRFFEYVIFDLACAYGTNPMRVIQTAAVIITFFAIILSAVLLSTPEGGTTALKVYSITGASTVDMVLTAFVDSTSTFVSGFDGVDKNVNGWPAILLTIEGLLGMLVLGLFIVAFSRKVIR